MRKYFIIALIFLALPVAASADGLSPSEGTDGLVNVDCTSNQFYTLYSPEDYSQPAMYISGIHTASTNFGYQCSPGNADLGALFGDFFGDWHVVITSGANCMSVLDGGANLSYTQCKADGQFISESTYTWCDGSCGGGPPPDDNTFVSMLDESSVGFQNTTGFDMSAVIVWSGDNLFKLFIGSALATLFYLRYWLIALLIIAAVIFFSTRAFVFFRH